ncbi:hypothetical protein [Tahibacter amnicola]|uniref:Hydrogenase expression/formation protein HypC n=1 Tax=Tahibacter amnicola TaxID=2976241 RepID=A0ABY6BPV4_9GAMM|nr:hypothetical protein [Tahibacter amnicola]UXI70450.1 hypothetical protein N4264_12685 [Tahibacter amnicola]
MQCEFSVVVSLIERVRTLEIQVPGTDELVRLDVHEDAGAARFGVKAFRRVQPRSAGSSVMVWEVYTLIGAEGGTVDAAIAAALQSLIARFQAEAA